MVSRVMKHQDLSTTPLALSVTEILPPPLRHSVHLFLCLLTPSLPRLSCFLSFIIRWSCGLHPMACTRLYRKRLTGYISSALPQFQSELMEVLANMLLSSGHKTAACTPRKGSNSEISPHELNCSISASQS